MSETDTAPQPSAPVARIRLPVWSLFAASFASVFSHPENFVRRAWLWIVLAMAAVLGFAAVGAAQSGWLDATVLLIETLGGLWFALGWHRGLLLQEPADWRGGFRFDLLFGRFAFIAVMIALWYGLVFFLVHLLGLALLSRGVGMAQPMARAILNFIASLLALPVAVRFLLGFPFAAVRNEPHAVSEGWRAAHGNVWRLSVLVLSIQLIFRIAIIVASATVGGVLGGFGLDLWIVPAVKTIGPIFVFLAAAVAASLASYSYAVLTGHPLAKEVLRQG